MTYTIGIKCEICGETETRPYDKKIVQMESIPNGWATFGLRIYPVDNEQDLIVSHHMCPRCAKAIREGKDPVHEHMVAKVTGGTAIYSMPKVEVIDLSDRPTVSEEEANL